MEDTSRFAELPRTNENQGTWSIPDTVSSDIPSGKGTLLEGVIAAALTVDRRMSYNDKVKLATGPDALATELGNIALPLLERWVVDQ